MSKKVLGFQSGEGDGDDESLLRELNQKLGARQFIGRSPVFLREIRKLRAIAATDLTVLIAGEPGTGKEICARGIHVLSPRASAPFVAVNCAAIPSGLVESALFGHTGNAFTGAAKAAPGHVQEADKGTLFLDEINSFSMALQPKLLRFVQEKEIQAVGESKTRIADVRIIAATNVDLEALARSGEFWEDFLYRLNEVCITMPALRDRPEDVPLLARHFVQIYSAKFDKRVHDLTEAALDKLASCAWPRNIRELENVIRTAVLFSEKAILDADDLKLKSPKKRAASSWKEARMASEKSEVIDLLAANGGNVSAAARAAGKDPRFMRAKLRKHNIPTPNPANGQPYVFVERQREPEPSPKPG